MKVIFCADPLDSKKVDIDCEREYNKAKELRQNGCPGRCAIFDFVLEPYNEDAPAVFENGAELSQVLAGKHGWNDIFNNFVEVIYKNIGEVLDEFYDNMKPIIGLDYTCQPTDKRI